jgi:hypothetical protein
MKKRSYNKTSDTLRIVPRRFSVTLGKHYAFWPIPSFYTYITDQFTIIGLVWFKIGLNCSIRRNTSL